jgi:RNA polymerase sigma-70 factor (ECF subfamily)
MADAQHGRFERMSLPSAGAHPMRAIDLDQLRPKLHRYCSRMVGSVLDGEDVVQEALLRALESPMPDRPIDNPEGWLFRIAHNLAIDLQRRRARTDRMNGEEDVESIEDPLDAQARHDAAAATLPVFMKMPATQRSVVILFDVLDYSAQEISEIVDTTVPAVKSTLQRGRERLRALSETSMGRQEIETLSEAEHGLLRRYVDLFNARDFDALREILAADVRLDLVNRRALQGSAVGEYFGRYGQRNDWFAFSGVVEGRPAVLMRQFDRPDGEPDYFVVLGVSDGRIATIRDFLFARYVMKNANYSRLRE